MLVFVLPAYAVTLNWVDNSDNEDGFYLDRSVNGTTFARIAVLSADTESYIDTDVDWGKSYWYKVIAYNVYGPAQPATGSITLPPPGNPPADATELTVVMQGTLINLSNMGIIDAGDVVIPGFVVAGGKAKVLIRAIGPSLQFFGVPDYIGDPQLQLFRDQIAITLNDNWEGDEAIAQAAEAVGAFALPPDSQDSAILIELDPGNYTAHASGVNNVTGRVLVEVYLVK